MKPLLLTRKKMIGMAVMVLIVLIALIWVQQKIAGLFQLM